VTKQHRSVGESGRLVREPIRSRTGELAVGGPEILQGSWLCGRRDQRGTARPFTVLATRYLQDWRKFALPTRDWCGPSDCMV